MVMISLPLPAQKACTRRSSSITASVAMVTEYSERERLRGSETESTSVSRHWFDAG